MTEYYTSIAELQRCDDAQLQQHLLQGVARTFALSIPQLPSPLAMVVANAYLLCRIADTIEDESELSLPQQHSLAQQFIDVVAAEGSAQAFAERLLPLLSPQRPQAERDLIQLTSRVVGITRSFNARQRTAIARCVTIMAEGMAYFQAQSGPTGLDNLQQLDNYCYHVAGVVGEMLTELICDYSPMADRQRERLQQLALSFGQGLQMTNILKDIWEDLDRGICWLPRDVFAAQGYDLNDLRQRGYSAEFGAGLERLIAITRAHLHNALEYTRLIPKQEQGCRKFCFWAIGMALLTLGKIHRQPWFTAGSQVKISKTSVVTIIAATRMAQSNNFLLRLLFNWAAAGLPVVEQVTTSQSHDTIREWFNARSEF